MSRSWQQNHKIIIVKFLKYLNDKSEDYILKGGTALMMCYNLDRFSEDIDLDSVNRYDIKKIVYDFVVQNNYEYRIAKDTDTVKRFMIHYGNVKSLKVEVSYRRCEINESSYSNIDNLKVYNIDELAAMKSAAYAGRDRIRDLYDMVFICNNYWDSIPSGVKTSIRSNIEYKGIEQFDYIMNTQSDELIDKDKLELGYLEMHKKLGLLT